MRIYITAKYKHWEVNSDTEIICKIIKDIWFDDFCFVRDIRWPFENDQDMMMQALHEIKLSDILLIDVSEKSTWRTIEAWIAYALWKKIILIAKEWTGVKDTFQWISNLIIYYKELKDIKRTLLDIYQNRKVTWISAT